MNNIIRDLRKQCILKKIGLIKFICKGDLKMKPYVICHMYVSIDGKIDGSYMEEKGCDQSGEYYDDIIFTMGTSMAGGRVTSQLYKAHGKNTLSQYSGLNVASGDYVIEDEHYQFCFDRMGKCFYEDNQYIYGGKTMQIVEVVSSLCDKRYLEYLRQIKVAYIIADNIETALNKIHEQFHVNRLVLTGGSIINGGFFKENCIDEISLVMAPYVEGNNEYKQFIGSLDQFVATKFIFHKAIPLSDGGVQLLFKKENKG